MELTQSGTTTVVSYTTTIQATATQLWEVITTPGILERCHPFCEKNEVLQWPGIGAKDTITYYNGVVLHRYFTKWEQGKGYELYIGRGRYAAAKVLWEIHPETKTTAKLAITIELFRTIALQRYPKVFRGLISTFYFTPNMQKYIQSVGKGFKYYLETGASVEKNQFGNNPLFSN